MLEKFQLDAMLTRQNCEVPASHTDKVGSYASSMELPLALNGMLERRSVEQVPTRRYADEVDSPERYVNVADSLVPTRHYVDRSDSP